MEAPTHDHANDFQHVATPGGRAVLWGGIGLGALLAIALLTHGFGLLGGRGGAGGETPPVVRKGGVLFVPEGSPLRQRLAVAPAPAELQSALVTAPGVVEPDPTRTVTVLPAGGGRVLAVKVALGDRVHRGQPLAVIDSPDLAQAYDDYDKAVSSAALARKNLGYQEAQLKIGAASQRDLDQARNDHQQAEAEHARARARLRAMGADEEARGANRLLTVRAPVTGSVTALAIAPGALINDDTQAIMSVADLSIVWVAAMVAEKDLPSVMRNQEAEVVVDAYAPKILHGKVLFVPDVLEADSRRNKTRIAFANPDYALKPNMFAAVTLKGSPRRRVVLPSSALLMNNDRTSVFVAVAPWTFERRTVEPLLEGGTAVTIASGVEPGEQVVVKGGILLND